MVSSAIANLVGLVIGFPIDTINVSKSPSSLQLCSHVFNGAKLNSHQSRCVATFIDMKGYLATLKDLRHPF